MPVQSKTGRGSANGYDLGDVIAWRLAYVENGMAAESAKDRKARLEGDMLELKKAVEVGLLISVDEIVPLWESAIVAARSELLRMPKKLKSKIKNEYGINVDIEFLMEHVDATLNRLAEGGWIPKEEGQDRQ